MHKCKGPSVLFGCKIVRCSQEETVGSLTHYQMDYVSVEVTFSPVLSGFRAPNFTGVLTAILYTFVTQTTPTH